MEHFVKDFEFKLEEPNLKDVVQKIKYFIIEKRIDH